ncbi:hypothetical protein PoB_006578900 [Plakobranchus ocellatus]|uniref:Uncharacterized protein n=1 Tax=Plakobranchus ocellatus TaxID=259542 RepID=A0AAV4D571_9GAST|nr:hypothetical protein PoB_006578900 [Plakobranchus ocellatus]
MAAFEGMHSPGSEKAHLLPPAGIKTAMGDMYRFQQVVPQYPPDPCIRPHEGDLVCPPEDTGRKNKTNMPPAGISMQQPSDRFAFYKAREGSSRKPCQSEGWPLQAEQVQQPCPCTNSSGYPLRSADSTDLRYRGAPGQPRRTCQPQTIEPGESYAINPSNCVPSNCWPLPHALRGSSQASNGQSQAQPGLSAAQNAEGTPYQAQQYPAGYDRPGAALGHYPDHPGVGCVSFESPRYDLHYMYPACVDREPMPHIPTVMFDEPSPYIKLPSTSPDHFAKAAETCRGRFSRHLLPDCPDVDPPVEPELAMLLSCRGPC